MKRVLLKLAIFLLTFTLGVYVNVVVRNALSNAGPASLGELTFELPFPPFAKTLVSTSIACGPNGSSTIYEYSDGGYVSVSCHEFASAAAANRHLQNRSLAGFGMIEWATIENNEETIIGETLVFTSPIVVRLATENDRFCETHASSVSHLRWFENGKYRDR